MEALHSLDHILQYAREHLIPVEYQTGDILVDYAEDPYLYIFESGRYSVQTHLIDGDSYEIGTIIAPDIIGEGILFDRTKKLVRVITTESGKAYRLTKPEIESISTHERDFSTHISLACLLASNDRIMEANLERMLLYTISDYLEKHTKNILPLLQSLKQLFSMDSIVWIERHEILEDVYAVRYNSEIPTAINARIDMHRYAPDIGCIRDFEGNHGCTFLFPIEKGSACYGYIGLSHSEKTDIPGYIGRVFQHTNTLFAEVIEEEWKKHRTQTLL